MGDGAKLPSPEGSEGPAGYFPPLHGGTPDLEAGDTLGMMDVKAQKLL